MKNKITEYLGIEPEAINEKINKSAIKEAETVETKYKNQLEQNIYHYGFNNDLPRFYDKTKEKIVIIENLNYITVFKIEIIK